MEERNVKKKSVASKIKLKQIPTYKRFRSAAFEYLIPFKGTLMEI